MHKARIVMRREITRWRTAAVDFELPEACCAPSPTLPRIAGEGQGVGVVIKTWDVASGSPISALQPGIKMITGEICRLR